MQNKHYVYKHIRLDNNSVFYIGLGSSKNYERAFVKHKRTSYWYNIVNKHGYRVEIISDNISKEEACELEEFLIQLYGRKDLELGNLVNLTNGGETNGGVIQSDKVKKWRSDKWKGELNPMFGKYGKLNPNFGVERPKEIKDKIAETHKNREYSEESIERSKNNLKNIDNSGSKNFHAVEVMHIETGIVFKSLIEGCAYFDIPYKKEQSRLSNNYTTALFKRTQEITKKEREIKKREKSTNISKKVINKTTGKIYDSITKASKDFYGHEDTLRRHLAGKVINKTDFEYYTE